MKNSKESEKKNKKRKKNNNDESDIALSLGCLYPTSNNHNMLYQSQTLFFPPISSPLPFQVPSPSTHLLHQDVPNAAPANPSSSRTVRTRRMPTNAQRKGKSETIPPPFPWATDKRAIFFSLNDLLQKEIFTVTGEVYCMVCKRNFEIGFDLKEKFIQVWNFIAENKSSMHDRAPEGWMNPNFPTCDYCGKDVRPVIAKKKRSINWLFLLLGQMVGYCTLDQLKYLCKHTDNHRTGAKDRVVYTVYLELCRQLDPDGPFHL